MHKVNLIKSSKTSQLIKTYRNRILLFLSSAALIFIIAYVVLLIRFIRLQNELTTLSNKQFQTVNGQSYSTEDLAKALYSQKKLEQIKSIYLSYPEYYLYHQFLLSRIFTYNSFTIDSYSLNKQHMVDVSLSTSNLDDIFSLITTLESEEVAIYFDYFEIENIELVKDKNSSDNSYRMSFVLEFNNKLLDEKTT